MRTLFSAALLALSIEVSAQFTEHIIDSTDLIHPRGVCAGDFDGDGDNDVAVISRENFSDSKLVWYANDGTGLFGPQQHIDQRPNPGEQVEAADLDGDGDLDLMATWNWGQSVRSYYNDGTGLFAIGSEIAYVSSVYRFSFLLADVTGDAFPDALISGDYPSELVLVVNDGAGGFLSQQSIPGHADNPVSLRSFDADLDGIEDLLYIDASLGNVVWHKGFGGGSFTSAGAIVNTNTSSVNTTQAADLNGDGYPDVLFKSMGSGLPYNALVWAENDTADFQGFHIITNSGGTISRLHTIDLDVDGDIDVIASRLTDETIEWYANDGAGSFSPAQVITTTCDSVWWITTADMDGDGTEDVIASAMRGNAVMWYGDPGFSTGTPGSAQATGLLIAPIPFGPSTVLTSQTRLTSAHRIRLIDAGGRTLRTWSGDGSRQLVIDRGGLPSGVYLVRLECDGHPVGQVRLIAE